MAQSGSWEVKWQLLVSDAWADEALMKRLLSESSTVLKERGIKVSPGVQVKVLADADNVAHLVVPLKPSAGELSEEQLSTVAAGFSHHHSHHSHHSHSCGHSHHHSHHHFG